jgi:hypothetical protein
MKSLLIGLILAAVLAAPSSSEAALIRRRVRAIRPRAAVVARAPARRVVAARPRVGPVRGAIRRAIGGR